MIGNDVKRAIGEIVNRTEQSDYVDERERIALAALDALLDRLARLQTVADAVEWLRGHYDHGNEDCEGHCVVERRVVADQLRIALAALGEQEPVT